MLYRLGGLMVRLRWWVIGFWVIVLAVSLPFAPRVTSQLKSGFGDIDTESRAALRLMTENLGIPESSITVVFSSDDLRVSDPRYADDVEQTLAPLLELPQVVRFITFYNTLNANMVSADEHTTYAFILIDAPIDDAVGDVPEIKSLLRPDSLDVWVTGGLAIFSDLNEASERDLRRAEIITLPLVLIALVIVFGSVVAAGLPLAMGVISIGTTLAIIYALAQFTGMSVFVLNIASFLGLGMAVDYSLLMVSRFREELIDHDTTEAVQITCATAGKAILFSAGTSAIGLSGLLFFQMMMLGRWASVA